jgi:hypothetical protein
LQHARAIRRGLRAECIGIERENRYRERQAKNYEP